MVQKKSNTAELTALIFRIGRLMRDEAHAKKGPGTQASFLHFHTLRYVKEHKRPLMRDVANYLLITPPAATLLIDGLVKDGFLARVIDRKDRRAVRLMITKRGELFLVRGMRNAMKKIAAIFSALDRSEQVQLVAFFRKVVKHYS